MPKDVKEALSTEHVVNFHKKVSVCVISLSLPCSLCLTHSRTRVPRLLFCVVGLWPLPHPHRVPRRHCVHQLER